MSVNRTAKRIYKTAYEQGQFDLGIALINERKCMFCGKKMINAVDSHTNKKSKYMWKCNCKKFPKDMIICIG